MTTLSLREFDTREADWALEADRKTLQEIRRLVFIVEQNVPRAEEWDGRDDTARHWLATDSEGRPIGTARLLPDGQIGRMAVLEQHRGRGVGAALLECAVEKARHLGFERVFLHAQTHALDFYRKLGFEPEGDEFTEAGIAHYHMVRELAPLEDEAQRIPAAGRELDVAIRTFDAAEVDWAQHGKIIRKIREAVLVRELGLDENRVSDADDEDAIHWQAVAPDGQTIGALRMDLGGNISRLAVLAPFRGQGVGHGLVELAVGKAQRFGWEQVRLSALTALEGFYRDLGFEPRGEPFTRQGLEHREYVRRLEHVDVFDRPRSALSGDAYAPDEVVYRLGADNRLLLLRKQEEFANVILEMTRQATQSIRIFSPVLEHKLFDKAELREVVSALARRNKYTRIEILIYDSHRMVKNGHALLEISRKLSSSIGMRIVHPELRSLNHEFVLADDCGVIYRHDYESWEGYANFNDITETGKFGRQFRRAWESGLYDPHLRVLKI